MMHFVRRLSTTMLLVTATWLLPIAAMADGRKAIEHFEAAMSLYEKGEYQQALKRFEAANEVEPAPVLLYNIAECHRQLGNNASAILYYRQYLAEERVAADRSEVVARIELLKAQMKADERTAPAVEIPAGREESGGAVGSSQRTGPTSPTKPTVPSPAQTAASTTAPSPTVAVSSPAAPNSLATVTRASGESAPEAEGTLWENPFLWAGVGTTVVGVVVLGLVLSQGTQVDPKPGDVGGVIQTLSVASRGL